MVVACYAGIFKIIDLLFQMTCVRLLEVVPVVFERLYPLNCDQTGSSSPILKSTFDFSWLHDLVDWGKSSLKVVFVYWKRTVSSLLKLLRSSCNDTDLLTVSNIENLISCGKYSIFSTTPKKKKN